MIRGVLFGLGVALVLVSLALGGKEVFGRVSLALGMPRVAAALFDAPDWRGVALFKAGDFDQAADTFKQAGPYSAFNHGNAEVQRENFAAALEAYDLALALGDDPQARINFDVVLAYYAGTRIEGDSIARWGKDKQGEAEKADVAKGAARASGTGDEVTNTGATIGLPVVQNHELRRVRKVFDDKFVVANPRWLATLEDVPGAYLAARISHEHKRRKKAGEGQPEMENEW